MLLRACLLTAALLLALAPAASAQVPPPAAGAAVTYQTFYDALSPYGQWVNDPAYGYVWVPAAGAGFQPYRTGGHWVYTTYGWTWVSDYAWGWAPFHYGRWRYADANGWVWVPGYSWGPAWVAWRQSAGYYGWAPLGPPLPRPGVQVSIGLSFSFGDAPVAPARWCFVPAAYVASPRIATYYVPPANTTVVYNQTTVINNTYVHNTVNNTTVVNNNRRDRGGYPAGPARADVERATGQPLQQLAVTSRATPGTGVQGKALAFYRPDVQAPAAHAGASAPAPRRTAPSLAEATRQARAARPGNGLARDNTAQQLSSTDAQPFRAARQRAAAQPGNTFGNTPGTTGNPAASDAATRPGRFNRQNVPDMATGGTPPATTDATQRQQLRQQRQQRQQARQQAQAGGQLAPDAQQLRAQRQQQRQMQDPAFQPQPQRQQRMQAPAFQPQRQQRMQDPTFQPQRQERMEQGGAGRMGGGERRRQL